MPKTAQPWFWKGRGWYLETNRKRTFLGKDKAEAYRAFYALMSTGEKPKNTIREIVVAFSEWVDGNRSSKTAKWYKDTLQSFLSFHPNLTVDLLKPFHVQRWMDTKVSNGTKRNYCRVMQRCLKWAVEQGYIDRSPIAHMRKPPPGIRDYVISDGEYARILAAAPPALKRVIEFANETGARAAEIIKLKREHVQGSRILLPRSEEKMQRVPRVIYLSEKALGLIGSSHGFLFKNSDGESWKIAAINSAFFRMKKKLGRQYCLTQLRHRWAHRMLTSGVDSVTVAALMGHSDTAMVAKVYGHINHATEFLLRAVEKAG